AISKLSPIPRHDALPIVNNPTACLWGCVDEQENTIIYKEYYERGQLVRDHAAKINQITAQLGVYVSYGVIDPSTRNRNPITGLSVHAAYGECGLPFALGNNDVQAGIERVSNRIKLGKLRITRDCVKTRWELNRYRWAKFVSNKSAQT